MSCKFPVLRNVEHDDKALSSALLVAERGVVCKFEKNDCRCQANVLI